MRTIHGHMETEEAERYVMGRSPEEEAAALEEHLLVCGRCRRHLSSTDSYVGSMSEAAAASANQGFTVYGNWQLLKLLAAAGAIAVLCLSAVLAAWYYRSGGRVAPGGKLKECRGRTRAPQSASSVSFSFRFSGW